MRDANLNTICVILLIVLTLGHASATEIIPLRYRTANDVIPIIAPLIPASGSISGFQNQMIINTTPENLEQVKKIIAAIDVLPKPLMISVRGKAQKNSESKDTNVSGRISNRESHVEGRFNEGNSNEASHIIQRVQTMEGGSAFINTGEAVPLRERIIIRTPQGTITKTDAIGYQNFGSGFYAVPRLSKDMVTVEIHSSYSSVNAQNQTINTQNLMTTISGRLGEWIPLGGVEQSQSSSSRAILGGSNYESRSESALDIRVEEIK